MHRKHMLCYFLVLFVMAFKLKSQEIPIGSWREHLSYKNALALTEVEDKLYCVTQSGIFSFNKSDNSYDRISKISGLSDMGAKTIDYNHYNKMLLIAYQNANIDLIEGNKIINIPDIKRKSILGNKTINSIYFRNQYAYLSCGFGVVVLDMDKKEIKDTYYIGTNGSSINVREVSSDGSLLMAATDSGIYQAQLSSPNLANFNSWKKQEGLPKGIYNTVAFFGGKFFANFSSQLTHNQWQKDSLFCFDGVNWSYYNPFAPHSDSSGYGIKNIRVTNKHMVMTLAYSVSVYNSSLAFLKNIYTYGFSGLLPNQSIIDKNGIVWVADGNHGLVKMQDDFTGVPHYPNGPGTPNVRSMAILDNKLWTVPGGVNSSWNNLFNKEGISSYINNTWSTINGGVIAAMDTLFDLMCVAIDPLDSDKIYAGSWARGVLEFNGTKLAAVYDQHNSPLAPLSIPGFSSLRVGSIAFDQDNNMWVTTGGTTKFLTVKKADGSWQNLDFARVMNPPSVAIVIINKQGQKWFALPRNEGILVYDDKQSFSEPDTSNARKLTVAAGKGALPSNTVMSIVEDHDGEIWIGTDKGIAVIYSPENVFSGGNFDAQRILIEQNGQVQPLLENETINAIAVDGANRKWIGTQGSGVYLMSEDGTKEIHHFTEENSSLLSNNVVSIAINHSNGEVFFGTAKGIISYKGTATEGLEDFDKVYSFPNPVRPDYEGPIAIKGLVQNVNVKITDISGSLVYETQAEGGQAIWNGKNFQGERVHSGVYLVFCSNEDGSKTFITKILFVN